uniref:Putative transferrin-like protein n=1 Tax=Panstrongylus lignarius TaxID=156445 RepID=A0A224XKM5_9HEMI
MKFRCSYIIVLNLILIHQIHAVYKICAFPTMDRNLCKSIEIGNSEVRCVRVGDSVDCALKMHSGDADFALLSPEEAVLLSKENNADIQLLGEVKEKSLANEPSSINMVVLIRKELSGSFSNLRGKKYCHPGVGISHRISDHFLKYFERYVIKFGCRGQYNRVEEEISQISNFFGDSCRPGAWARSRSLDVSLKKQYKNLCKLCDSDVKCSYNLVAPNSLQASLKCLTRNGGEVAVAPLEEVRNYFGLKSGSNIKNNADDYVYLCKDEKTMEITNPNPCTWGKQPWDLIVSRSAVAQELKDKIVPWLITDSEKPGSDWLNYLKSLLIGQYKQYSAVVDTVKLQDYINRDGVDDPDRNAECRDKIKWCTIGKNEYEKCNWLSLAAQSYGLKPSIGCHRGHNLYNCFRRIAGYKEDAISIFTEHGYVARRVYNLTATVYEDNTLESYYKILAVVKADNTNIQSFRDLKYKKACFPQYNGLAWISFKNIAKVLGILDKTCPELYFGNSCIPGAFDVNLVLPDANPWPASMCELCAKSNATHRCPVFGTIKEQNLQTMTCLSQKDADIAFINYQALLTDGDTKTIDETINPNLYKVLCRNGTFVPGLAVENDCALATGINAEVIGRVPVGGRDNINFTDATELFLELNKAFGTIGIGEDANVFRMFDPFNGEEVLFKDTSIGLVDVSEDKYFEQINLYESLLSNVTDKCKGDAYRITFTKISLITIFMILIEFLM